MSSSLTIRLPRHHPGQRKVEAEARRYNVLACGRRWGKSKYLTRRMALCALRGEPYGYFGATYKLLTEVFREVAWRLGPVAKVSKSERRIELLTGGLIEFWTLEDQDAGRSRRYAEVGIDEAGLVKDLEQIWHNAIRPTLADLKGKAWLAGTPKGRGFFHTAFTLGQDPTEAEWASWQMPTAANPYIDPAEIEAARHGMPDRSFRQEFLAEFLDEAGGVFRLVREAVDIGQHGPRDGTPPYYMGIDLARTQDFTVVTVLDSSRRQIEMHRLNQVSWERQIALITSVAGRYPGAQIVLDSTGVGDPIYERLRGAGLSVTGFQFTNSSKEQLIDNLAMRIEQGEVRLLDDPIQTAELLAYEYQLTAARNVRMNAPEGMHDDTVIALALAVWGTTKSRLIAFS